MSNAADNPIDQALAQDSRECPGCSLAKPIAEFTYELQLRSRRRLRRRFYFKRLERDHCVKCAESIQELCSACHEPKPLADFYYTWSGHACLKSGHCRDCWSRARKRSQRSRLRSTPYSIRHEQFLQMTVKQGGVCMVCGQGPAKDLVVDHCHTTGRIRGLLCGSCNMGLGLFKDDPKRLKAAVRYLEEHFRALLFT
jgi:Recombination endonuclease VII